MTTTPYITILVNYHMEVFDMFTIPQDLPNKKHDFSVYQQLYNLAENFKDYA